MLILRRPTCDFITMNNSDHRRRRSKWITVAVTGLLVVAASVVWSMVSRPSTAPATLRARPAPVAVVTAHVETRDVPVRLRANGTVIAPRSVDLRAQVTSTVRAVHFREGQTVRAGDLLFSLDAAADEAALRKAQAQIAKDRLDLAAAQRNLERVQGLFQQTFVSQSALEQAQSQVDAPKGQLEVNQAALQAARAAVGLAVIRAPFAARAGAIGVHPGGLAQPNGQVLVTLVQTDPIHVGFTLPEKELVGLREALASRVVEVIAMPDGGKVPLKGKLVFLDNAVDSATGTIRVKAEFANGEGRLWPGMHAQIGLAPRTMLGAMVVPVQAVQTGPEQRFLYVVDKQGKVAASPVSVAHIDAGIAVVEGVPVATRVVVEGAQNLRPGSMVVEADRAKIGAGDGKGSAEEKSAPALDTGKRKTASGTRA